jgi:hypothetical protein
VDFADPVNAMMDRNFHDEFFGAAVFGYIQMYMNL